MQSTPVPDTIPRVLQLRAELTPHQTACFHRSPGGKWIGSTWVEYRAEIERVAVGLHREGLLPGDRMLILIPTSREWEIARHAALMNGAIIVGLDPRASAQEIAWVMDHAQVNWALSLMAALPVMGDSRLRDLKHAVVLDAAAPRTANYLPWTSLAGSDPPPGGFIRELGDQRSPEDVATIIYTSGTTGLPKGIAVTHRQLLVACEAIAELYTELEEGDTTVCWLPLSALFQRMVNLVAMARGLTTYFLDDPRNIFESLDEIRPALLIGVPRFYQKLLETLRHTDPEASARWRRRLKFMVSGSAPISTAILQELQARGILVLEAYGISENTVPMAANTCRHYRFGTVGRPLPQNEIRFEPDDEILVRSPGLFAGYYREAFPTDRFTEDGFYRTGDCGYLDPDGYLCLTGRKAEIIKTSTGRRISPVAVETIYGQIPFIDQIAVFGDGQKYLVALIALDRAQIDPFLAASGAGPAEDPHSGEQIKRWLLREMQQLEEQLSVYERVMAVGILSEPLTESRGELTAAGKLRRKVIAANYAHLLKQLFQLEPPAVLGAWEVPVASEKGSAS
jgi:long-chain acyl-CoA synthetase